MPLENWQYPELYNYGRGDAVDNPFAYGSIPDIPETTTNITRTTSGWTPTIPDYEILAPQASKLAETQMSGKLAPDVIAQIAQGAAERGVAIGAPTSPNADAAYLRALGLTSQGLQQQGMANYLSLLSQSPRITTSEAQQILSNNVLRAQMAAAPDPYAAAMANLAAQRRGLAAGGAAGGGGGYPVSAPTSTYTPGSAYTQPSGFYGTVNPLTGQTVTPAYDIGAGDTLSTLLAQLGIPTTDYTASTPGTYYDPWSDTSYYSPTGARSDYENWADWYYEGSPTSGYEYAPEGTSYDPWADQSYYDPYYGEGSYYDNYWY